jgi:hypothetical protein
MSLAESVRNAFAESAFGAPVSSSELEEAEAALGHALPPVLRELYAAFDGFTGPTNAPFLFPLVHRPGPRQDSALAYTDFLRAEIPSLEWLRTAVALGGPGTGSSWFVSILHPDQVWEWDAEWGDEYEVLEGSLLDVWLAKKAMYDALAAED